MIIDNTQCGEEGTAPAMAAAGASTREWSNILQTGNANGGRGLPKGKELRPPQFSGLGLNCVNLLSYISLPWEHLPNEQIEKLKLFKMMLERSMLMLQLNKHEIQLSHKDKLFSLEKYINFFLSGTRPHKPTSSPLQGQLPHPSIHTSQAQNTYAHQPHTVDSDGQDIASKFD